MPLRGHPLSVTGWPSDPALTRGEVLLYPGVATNGNAAGRLRASDDCGKKLDSTMIDEDELEYLIVRREDGRRELRCVHRPTGTTVVDDGRDPTLSIVLRRDRLLKEMVRLLQLEGSQPQIGRTAR